MFILKSAVKFMSEVFPLFVGGFSDIMEEPEIDFFICRSRILDRVLFSNIISVGFT